MYRHHAGGHHLLFNLLTKLELNITPQVNRHVACVVDHLLHLPFIPAGFSQIFLESTLHALRLLRMLPTVFGKKAVN